MIIKCNNIFVLIDSIQQCNATSYLKINQQFKDIFSWFLTFMWVHAIIEQDFPIFKHINKCLFIFFNYKFTSYDWVYAIRKNIDNNQESIQNSLY